MMTSEEKDVVKLVFKNFLDNEVAGWEDLDENIIFYDWLKDEELIAECYVKRERHVDGISCAIQHPNTPCFAPVILEAVEAILRLHKSTGELHPNNRYVLLHYVAMCEMEVII